MKENNEMRIILALVSNPGLDRATIPRPVSKTRPVEGFLRPGP